MQPYSSMGHSGGQLTVTPRPGGLVVSWPEAASATAGYRLYRSTAPFVSGAPYRRLAADRRFKTDRDAEQRCSTPTRTSPCRCRPGSTGSTRSLEGCTTYHYAVASVNCDETLVAGYLYNSNAALSDYAVASVTRRLKPRPRRRPVLDASPGGEQRVFITMTNPLAAAGADFDRTEIYWSRAPAPAPHFDGTMVSAGSLLPDSEAAARAFSRTGEARWLSSTARPMRPRPCPPSSPARRTTFSRSATTTAATCPPPPRRPPPSPSPRVHRQSPGGPPPAPTGGTLRACEADSVALDWAYGTRSADFAGFRITRSKNGGAGVELADGSTPAMSWTDAGPLEAGAEYAYTIAATDCALGRVPVRSRVPALPRPAQHAVARSRPPWRAPPLCRPDGWDRALHNHAVGRHGAGFAVDLHATTTM